MVLPKRRRTIAARCRQRRPLGTPSAARTLPIHHPPAQAQAEEAPVRARAVVRRRAVQAPAAAMRMRAADGATHDSGGVALAPFELHQLSGLLGRKVDAVRARRPWLLPGGGLRLRPMAEVPVASAVLAAFAGRLRPLLRSPRLSPLRPSEFEFHACPLKSGRGQTLPPCAQAAALRAASMSLSWSSTQSPGLREKMISRRPSAQRRFCSGSIVSAR